MTRTGSYSLWKMSRVTGQQVAPAGHPAGVAQLLLIGTDVYSQNTYVCGCILCKNVNMCDTAEPIRVFCLGPSLYTYIPGQQHSLRVLTLHHWSS